MSSSVQYGKLAGCDSGRSSFHIIYYCRRRIRRESRDTGRCRGPLDSDRRHPAGSRRRGSRRPTPRLRNRAARPGRAGRMRGRSGRSGCCIRGSRGGSPARLSRRSTTAEPSGADTRRVAEDSERRPGRVLLRRLRADLGARPTLGQDRHRRRALQRAGGAVVASARRRPQYSLRISASTAAAAGCRPSRRCRQPFK